MNKTALLIYLLMVQFHMAPAQLRETNLLFKGPVKTMTFSEPDNSETRKALVSVFEYDKKYRKVKEKSPYNSTTSYYYAAENANEPVLQISHDTGNGREVLITVEERNTAGQPILKGDIRDGKWNYYYIHQYTTTENTINWFIDGEIYNHKTIREVDLAKHTIPQGFVPFEWDHQLSKGSIIKNYAYPDKDKRHELEFEYIEKGQPKNKIIFSYNGPDMTDPGDGTWQHYQDNKIIEKRYIYKANRLTDFGHRYNYDSKGNIVSDHYGYFNKMPHIFMQRVQYQYNDQGDCIAEIHDAENEKTYTTRYLYTYDSHNNWISRKTIYSDGSGGTVTRSFTYYQPSEPEIKNSITPERYNDYVQQLRAYQPIAAAQYKNYIAALEKKQQTVVPVVNYTSLRSAKWQDFLPAQQVLDTMATGDLNKDGLDDLVMVYQAAKLLQSERNEVRTLSILLQQTDGNYQLAAASTGAVAGETLSYVYFNEIAIRNGILMINHDFLRGGSVHKWRYQNGGFYLIGAQSSTGDASYHSSIDYNLSTGKYITIYDNYDDNKELPQSSKKEGIQKPRSLPDIASYELFSVEIAGHHL